MLLGVSRTFTTEARRHGEKPSHVCVVPHFDNEPWERSKPWVAPSVGDRHERNSWVQIFSESPCLRGSCACHPRYLFALRSSALRTAAPAAPRIVLCDRTVNFQSRTLHLRKRPTAVVMPAPRSTSKRGCGRSAAVIYTTGCSGALGD